MNNPIISIIVPVYNVARFVSECIDSILRQTYTFYEVILVNDGSTDGSKTICEKYVKQDKRINLCNKLNGGLSSARNHGLDKAKGEYIIFIDSDDFWTDAYVLERLMYVAESTKADVIRGEYKEVDENGNDLYIPAISEKTRTLENQVLDCSLFMKKILSRGHFSWLFFYKKDVIENYRFNVNQKFQEDIEFNIRFFSKARTCVYTTYSFYAYRKRTDSIMNTPKIENLKYSFLLSTVWYKKALELEDESLKRIYIHNSTMMYYSTLESISLDVYYKDKSTIIDSLSLNELQIQIKEWAIKDGRRLPFIIYLRPCNAIVIFRYIRIFKTYVYYWKEKIKFILIHNNK